MAEYSSKSDVKDPVLAAVTQEADHAEAERTITRELKRLGISPASVADPELLKELSTAYASWIRCKYEMQKEGDAFHIKLKEYRAAYEDGLKRLTADLVADRVSASGGMRAFGTIEMVRG